MSKLEKKRVAIIPARAGSKRLPNKNLKILGGKPLIAWTISAALDCELFDSVVVSTDSADIASVSKEHGAEVPFIRPAELASDTAGSVDVLLHAVTSLGLNLEDTIAALQPTSPLRSALDLVKAFQLKDSLNASGVVSVTKCEHSPLWSNQLAENLSMHLFLRPELLNKRSQDLGDYYRLNGAIYIYDVDAFIENKGVFYNDSVFAYIMSQQRSVDIDTLLDFSFAEFLVDRQSEKANL